MVGSIISPDKYAECFGTDFNAGDETTTVTNIAGVSARFIPAYESVNDSGETVEYHNVTFDGNNGCETEVQYVAHGSPAKPVDPVSPNDDSRFVAWFEVLANGRAADNPFDFATPITKDITLEAFFADKNGAGSHDRYETIEGAPIISGGIGDDLIGNYLTPEELDAYYGLLVVSSPYVGNDVPQADKEALEAQAQKLGVTQGEWFDISLYKMKEIHWGSPPEMLNREGTEKMTSVSVPIELTVEIPDELQKSGRTFYLLSCHDGAAAVAAQGKKSVLSWKSDKFSTYLIAYKDTVCPRDDTCPMTPFTDADKQVWYHDGVHWALEEGVMNGTGKSTFEPLTVTSRAMIVTMLWRMEGKPLADGNITFKDVQDGRWYTEAIRWADEAMHWMTMNGIIQGMSAKELSPQGVAVRAQTATMLMRFSEKL